MAYNFDQIIERRGTDSLKWAIYPRDVIPLWVADMDFQAPEPVCRALRGAIDHGVLGYEFPVLRTKEVIARRMQRLYGWQVDPDWVVSTIGVVHGFNAAARMLCGKGEGVLIQPPVYHMFYSVHANLGLTTQEAPFEFTGNGNRLTAHFDKESFARAIHSHDAKTRMFLLCHPHNPIGRVFERDELHAMAEACLQNDVVIVSDEIHCELMLGEREHIPMATLSQEIAQSTITLLSASKAFNLCGLFCGFAIIPNSNLRARFTQVLEQLAGHVASLGLVASEAAFAGECDEWLTAVRQYLKDTRDLVVQRLTDGAPGARFVVPDATYLQWIDLGEYVQSGRIQGSPQQYLLEHAKVALHDGKIFGAGYENFVRLNFAAPRSLVDQALEQMVRALS